MEAYLEGHKKMSIDELRDIVTNVAEVLFYVVDSNHDDKIQWKEYQDYLRILQQEHDPDIAKYAFNAVDLNGDGILSKEEFISACLEFFSSQDDTPSKYFYGPLVE